MTSYDSFPFTYIYNVIKEYAQIAPHFTHNQIKEFLLDLKRNQSLFDKFIMNDGDAILKMSMSIPEIFKETLEQGLGHYSRASELIQWALFCGPESPSHLPPMTLQRRKDALHIILDTIPAVEFQKKNLSYEYLTNLLYFPADSALITKFLDRLPFIKITDEWILNFLHRGNSENIPYIVSHKFCRDIVYQNPDFLTTILPRFRHILIEDISMMGPNDTQNDYYKKLVSLHAKIESAKPIIRKANWALLFWFSIFYIRIRQFLARYYEPGIGRGFQRGAESWRMAATNASLPLLPHP